MLTKTRLISLVVLATFLFACECVRRDYSDLPAGPYCQVAGCCHGRKDECSMPIIGTKCYCDDFCDEMRVDDCCPDYWSVCKGEPLPTLPPLPPTTQAPPENRACTYEGRNYGYGRTIKKNCNLCKCEELGGQLEWACEQNECMIEPDIIEEVNNDIDIGWTATNYSKFWGKTLDEGITYRLGTLQPQHFVMAMNPVRRIYDPNALPREFDAEKKWPSYITGIQDQLWCGSSWAISTAAVASDRFGIISKGIEKVKLSAQNLLSCDLKGQQSCKGGRLDKAWLYIRRHGIVDEDCFPYVGYNEKCKIPHRGNLISAHCSLPANTERTSKYRVAPAYRLGNETDIMYDIMHSGPVQATILVHQDFYSYKEGIYKHRNLRTSAKTGYLSVRIVGWGEEYGFSGVEKYWKVANSWGRDWGEDGYIRILKGKDESEIESFVLATWPEIEYNMIHDRDGHYGKDSEK